MAGSSEEMNNHDDEVKRPENAPENSNTCSPGAPRGHRKKDAEVMIDRVVREKFPRLDATFPVENSQDGRAVQIRGRYLVRTLAPGQWAKSFEAVKGETLL